MDSTLPIPRTIEEAVQSLLRGLTPEDLQAIKNMAKSVMETSVHHGLRAMDKEYLEVVVEREPVESIFDGVGPVAR